MKIMLRQVFMLAKIVRRIVLAENAAHQWYFFVGCFVRNSFNEELVANAC